MLLSFTTIATAKEEDLSFPFTPNSGLYWQYISDRTMGGVSNGQVTLEQDGEVSFAKLTGNVSTRNNGGFIQLRSGISFANSEKGGKALQGVRLNVRGNGEIYHISSDEIISIRNLVKFICLKMKYNFSKLVKISPERPGKDKFYILANKKLKKDLKWNSKITLDEGINRCIDWIKKDLKLFSKSDENYIHKK